MIKKNINILVLTSFSLILLLNNCGYNSTNLDFLKSVPANILEETNLEETNINTILKKQVKDMSHKEALIAKAFYEQDKDIDMTIKCSERILAVCSNQEIAQKTTLQLAQIYLDQGNFDKAEKYAHDYQTLYPGTREAKTAAYINIQSNFLSILAADRDQKKTEKTIELAQNFLEKYQDQDDYQKSIYNMVDTCYSKLLDREISVINTYLTRYNYYKNFSALNAAQRRFAYINEKLLPYIKTDKERITKVELALSKASKDIKFVQVDQQNNQSQITT